MSVAEAAEKADIIHILLPDESHGSVYEAEIKPHLKAGKTLCCSHGFAYVFNTIVPPADVDVIMVAPKGPGTEVRRVFEEGFGCPGLIAVHQNPSGQGPRRGPCDGEGRRPDPRRACWNARWPRKLMKTCSANKTCFAAVWWT